MLTADQTAQLFTAKLRAREPFVHIRFGDADYDWMRGGNVPTCDRELFRPEIGEELRHAWNRLWEHPEFYLGDIATFRTPAAPAICEYAAQLVAQQDPDRLVHTEALLIHRQSQSLVEFYRTLRDDARPKLLVAPDRLMQAGSLLDAFHIIVDETQANARVPETIERIERHPWQVLITACGRASKLIAGELATRYPDRTIVELGSGLDPLFVGRTRSEQLPRNAARALFRELL